MPNMRRAKIEASARLDRSSSALMRAGGFTGIAGVERRKLCSCILADCPMETIRIRGARTHNLKNVSLDLPRNRLIVITGPVGLGQVVARLRHALRRGPAPLRRVALGVRAPVPAADGEARRRPDRGPVAGDRDRAEGDSATTRAPPSAPSPRSTTTCACSSRASARRTAPSTTCRSQAQTRRADGRPRARAARGHAALMILAPVVVGRKGEQAELSTSCARRASCALRIDGKVHELDELPKLDRNAKHTIDVVVDRLKVRASRGCKQRLAESFETALRHADGRAHRRGDRQRARSTFSRRSSPARSAATRSPNSSRACSRSTTRWAPARAATASARSTFFDPEARGRASRTCRSPAAPSAAGTGATSSTSRCSAVARAALRLRRRGAVRVAAGASARQSCCTARARRRSRSAT